MGGVYRRPPRDVQYGILIIISAVPAAGMCYISPPECYEALGAKKHAKIACHSRILEVMITTFYYIIRYRPRI
jgi:hypothetical protein